MKFLVIYTADAPGETASRTSARGETMTEYAKRSAEAGILLSQAMFDPRVSQVRQRAGAVEVTERADRATGYAFLEAPTHDDAVAMTKEFLEIAGDGACEVRGVVEGPPQ